ncbi:hypothetical protein DIPPA_16706 [Diplonema papillatum]|nr:hypothetical protein DIPPA_16706 [Diplonema papillatum]
MALVAAGLLWAACASAADDDASFGGCPAIEAPFAVGGSVSCGEAVGGVKTTKYCSGACAGRPDAVACVVRASSPTGEREQLCPKCCPAEYHCCLHKEGPWCCKDGYFCCASEGVCAASKELCCGAAVCKAGETCVDMVCCNETRACGSQCCGDGEFCYMNETCQPAGPQSCTHAGVDLWQLGSVATAGDHIFAADEHYVLVNFCGPVVTATAGCGKRDMACAVRPKSFLVDGGATVSLVEWPPEARVTSDGSVVLRAAGAAAHQLTVACNKSSAVSRFVVAGDVAHFRITLQTNNPAVCDAMSGSASSPGLTGQVVVAVALTSAVFVGLAASLLVACWLRTRGAKAGLQAARAPAPPPPAFGTTKRRVRPVDGTDRPAV